jgi:hypothetical protein
MAIPAPSNRYVRANQLNDFIDAQGLQDPAALRAASQGGRYNQEARRAAIAEALAAQQQQQQQQATDAGSRVSFGGNPWLMAGGGLLGLREGAPNPYTGLPTTRPGGGTGEYGDARPYTGQAGSNPANADQQRYDMITQLLMNQQLGLGNPDAARGVGAGEGSAGPAVGNNSGPFSGSDILGPSGQMPGGGGWGEGPGYGANPNGWGGTNLGDFYGGAPAADPGAPAAGSTGRGGQVGSNDFDPGGGMTTANASMLSDAFDALGPGSSSPTGWDTGQGAFGQGGFGNVGKSGEAAMAQSQSDMFGTTTSPFGDRSGAFASSAPSPANFGGFNSFGGFAGWGAVPGGAPPGGAPPGGAPPGGAPPGGAPDTADPGGAPDFGPAFGGFTGGFGNTGGFGAGYSGSADMGNTQGAAGFTSGGFGAGFDAGFDAGAAAAAGGPDAGGQDGGGQDGGGSGSGDGVGSGADPGGGVG